MKRIHAGALLATLFTGTLLASVAHADSVEAMCEARKDGDKQKGKSGPCTFSQRQGYIDIQFKNGDNVNLTPAGNNPGQYRDGNGNKVTRTSATSMGMDFKWADGGRKLTVTWQNNRGYDNGYNNTYEGYEQKGHNGNNGNYGNSGEHRNDYFINNLDNGGFEVVWKNPSCFISYNGSGRSISTSQGCTGDQIGRSNDIARSRTR